MSRSIAFPIRLDPKTQTLAVSSGNKRTEESILEVLTTDFLGRVLRPSFGTDNFIFTAISDPGVISSKIKFALDTYLSKNIITAVYSSYDQNGGVSVDINWFDSSTSNQGNVKKVFSF